MNKFYIIACFILCAFSYGQDVTNINGRVTSQQKVNIPNVSVVIYLNKSVTGYTYTNDQGYYTVKIKGVKKNDSIKLKVNGLGYKNTTYSILFLGEKKLTKNFTLEEKVEELNEIVLEAWEKIKVNKDTITFKAQTYMNGSEQVVEDLLKKLPGVEVLTNGTIKVNGKTIDKLLIEDDDLFDDKYKLLSKNLDAKNISEVQILNNFEDNPILKSFQDSEKVALNLKLKKNKKNIWFGNINLGIGTNERYEGSANLGLLKKKIKIFNLTSLNNTKKRAVPQVKSSSNIEITNSATENKVEHKNNSIVNIDNISNSQFSGNEDVFNNSLLNSLSFVTSLSKKTKLRSLSYYALDKFKKQNQNFTQYFTTPELIEYSEDKKINTKDILFASDIELKYYNKKNTYVTYNFSYENNPVRVKSNLFSNENIITQAQNNKQQNFYNHLSITKKLNKNNLLKVYSYYGVNNTKQNFLMQPNIFYDEQETGPKSFVQQNSDSPLNYFGVITEIVTKIKKSEFALELLTSYDFDKINSSLQINNKPKIDSLSNNTKYEKKTFSATGRYSYAFSEVFELKSSLNLSKNYTKLNNSIENLFFINPRIGFLYKGKQGAKLRFHYSYKNNLPNVSYLNQNYILKNYRTFSKGLKNITPSKNQNFSLRYTYNNYNKLFLINSRLTYRFSNINYATESIISQTSTYNTYKILDGGNSLDYDLGITKYLNNFPLSLKLNTLQTWNTNQVILNNSSGTAKNYYSNYRIQGTTYLKIPLNFKFNIQYNYSVGQFNNQKTSNDYIQGSLTSILELSKKWVIQMNNDYYSLNNNNLLFTNLDINFNPKESNWSYKLTGNNLLNITDFNTIYISENQKRSSKYKIVPRYLLLNIKYRF